MAIAVFPKATADKVPYGIGLNRGHPLCPNLACFLFNQGSGSVIELVQSNVMTTPAQYIQNYQVMTTDGSSNSPITDSSGNQTRCYSTPAALTFIMKLWDDSSYSGDHVNFVAQTNSSGGDNYSVHSHLTTKQLQIRTWNSINGYSTVSSSSAIPTRTWSFQALSLDLDQNASFYAEGKFVNAVATHFGQADNGNFYVLAGWYNQFAGKVEYLYLYSRALSATEISALYYNPYAFVQPQSPQRRYWTASPTPPVTGVVPDKISLGYFGGVSVRSVPSLGSTGGNGVA